MTTNILAYLHTTLAYQSAAMHLIVGQANFDAQHLNLRESLPIVVPADTNAWHVPPPPDGITTRFMTSNCVYQFQAGNLVAILCRKLPRTGPETGPSLIDTNGADQLAHQWLAALSVNVAALDQKYPHTVESKLTRVGAQAEGPRRNSADHRGREKFARPNETSQIPPSGRASAASPVFRVTWGGGGGARMPMASHGPIVASVEILGSTRQCVGLQINPGLLTAPPLRVTNAEALLGPVPTAQHFLEELLGGPAGYNAVAAPDHVQVWLLGLATDGSDAIINRTDMSPVSPAGAAKLSHALVNFDSYTWINESSCAPTYIAAFRFTKGADTVDVAWNADCDHVKITSKGRSAERDCQALRPLLLQALQTMYPNDSVISTLSP